jgi:lysophospholipase L1-like esterase
MRSSKVVLAVWLACLSVAPLTWAQSDFYLKDGDRVVFYGDSITEQRLYTTYTETYVVTRFPQLNVSFVHSGVGGDRVTGGWAGPIDLRLKRDVFPYKPTVMTIMLGMNDGKYRAFDEQIFDVYKTGFEHILASVKVTLPGIRLTLIEPSPYDDVTRAARFPGGYNAIMVRYGQFVKELSRQQGCDLADLNTSIVAALEKAEAADPKTAQKIIPDRVHPGPSGHLLMAEALLKAWNAPATVTDVQIDATAVRAARADNTEVSGLKASDGLSWTQNDKALPMPVNMEDPVVRLAMQSSDFFKAVDWQPLKVTGLKDGRYLLKIDGQEMGTFSREQLAEGLNLAELPTPMVKQSEVVHNFTVKHNNVHAARWRELQVALGQQPLPHKSEAMEALDKVEADLVALQRQAAQPKAYHYELLLRE